MAHGATPHDADAANDTGKQTAVSKRNYELSPVPTIRLTDPTRVTYLDTHSETNKHFEAINGDLDRSCHAHRVITGTSPG